MGEKWKDVKGYEGYIQVSNYGQVRSLPQLQTRGEAMGNITYYTKGRILAQQTTKHGYKKIRIGYARKKKQFFVHVLVLEAFVSKRPSINGNKLVCNHKDGDKTNNNVENLEWVTQRENQLHAITTGLRKTNKIDKYKLYYDYIVLGLSAQSIANELGVNVSTVSYYIKSYGFQRCRIGREISKYEV